MIDHIRTVRARTEANVDLAFRAPGPVGRFAFDVSADQPTAALPDALLDAVEAALRAGQTHYVDVPGMANLRAHVASALTTAGRYPTSAEHVVVTASVQEARFLALQVLSETLPVVAVPEVVHPGVRQALGVRAPREVLVMPVDASRGFVVDPAAVEAALAAGARLVFLEAPVRLSGARYAGDALARIAAAIDAHDAHLVLDDGFVAWLDAHDHGALAGLASSGRLTTLSEVLPGIGLEGWALGALATSPAHVAGITKLKQIMSICTSTPTQVAAIEAFERGLDDPDARLARARSARASAAAAARSAGGDVVPGDCAHVLAVRGLAGVPTGAADGALFGAPGVVRLKTDGTAAASVLRSHGVRAGGAR